MEICVTVHKLTIATVFVQSFTALARLSSTHATQPAETGHPCRLLWASYCFPGPAHYCTNAVFRQEVLKTGRFSYCKGEKQVASYCLQFRTTFSPRRFQPQYIATMRKTSRCCLGRESRAGPGGWHRHARGQGPGASHRPGPEAAALAAEADRSAVREGTLRWPSPAVRPAGGEARRGVGWGGGPVPRPGRHGFRFRLPLSRPFLVPCRLSPKSRGAAVPASALPLPPPPPRLRTAPGRGRRGAAGRRPPHAPSGWSVGRVGERGSQSLTREVGGEVRQLAPKESGGSGTAVQ